MINETGTPRTVEQLQAAAEAARAAGQLSEAAEFCALALEQSCANLEATSQGLRQRNAELAIINSIQQGLAQQLDFQGIIDLVGDQVRETFSGEATFIALYDKSTNLLSFPYIVSSGGRRLDHGPLGLGLGLTSIVIESRKPLVLGTHQEGIDLGAIPFEKGSRELEESWMGVPILVGDEVTGVVAVQDWPQNRYDEADVRLLGTLAASMGVALENARLFEETNRLLAETQQRNAELAVVNSVQQGLARQLDFDGIIDLVGDKVREIFHGESTYIALYDKGTNLVRFPYFRGSEGQVLAAEPVLLGSGLTSIVIESRQPLVLGTLQQMLDLGAYVILDESGTTQESFMGVPILVGDDVTGIVAVQDWPQNRYDEADVRLLSTLAASMGVALENARLFEETIRLLAETQQRNAELAVINSVQEGLARQLDFSGIIDLVGDQVRETFHGETTFIALYDKGTNMVRCPYFLTSGGQRLDPEPFEMGTGLTSVVIESRQPLVIGTLQQMYDMGGVSVDDGTGKNEESWMGVPILVGDQVTGVVAVQDWPQNRYDEADVRLLSTLASAMGVALESARLFEETNRLLDETQQRNAELSVINSVQQGLVAELDMQAIYDLVGDQIRDIFDAQMVGISIYDHGAQTQLFKYVIEKGERHYFPPYPINDLHEHLIETRQTVLINENAENVMAEFGMRLAPGTERPKSLVFVPLIVGQDVRGYVTLQNIDREHTFSPADIRLLTTLANTMSVALESGRLFEETQQRNAELAIINDVGQALARQLESDAIIELVGSKAGELFDADATTVVLYDRKTGLVHLPYMVEGEHRFDIEPYPLGPGLNSKIIETRQPLLLGTLQEQLELGAISYQVDPDEPDARQSESWLGVPLIVGEEAIGVINVQSYRQHAFDESDVRLLNTLTANAGVALENARLFGETNRLLDESRQRAAEMATVNRISQALASELELGALIELVGEQVRHTFQADIAYVALLDPQTSLIQFPYGFGEDFSPITLGEGVTSRILQTGEPLLINEDVLGRHDEMGIEHVGVPSRSYLGVPIPIGRDVIGVISVQSTQETGRFGQEDVRLLTTVAANVGAAIQNARLFAEVEGQKQYSESIVNTSPVAIVTVNREGQVLTWNPAAERLFGYTEVEAVGQDLDPMITTPETAEEAAEYTRRTVSGSSVHAVTRRRTRDGRTLDVELMSVPVDAGDPDAVCTAIYHDITELKQTEQELQAAKEAAEAANQAKSAFLATMSHEIRTPMNAVIGMTSLLLDTELTPEQQEFAETIRTSGDALLAVINDILDFSKIEAGRIDLELQPFDLRECVEGAVGLMAARAAEKGLELGCLVDAGVPAAIMGDEARLRQILLNLLSNAVKFTDEGEVLLAVQLDRHATKRTDNGQRLHFSVRDTGIGIPADRVDRLFQSFSQVDSSTTRRYGGTGLGLAISKRLSELMGGAMWVESPALGADSARGGPGSTFHFTIQAEEAPAPARAYLRATQADLRDKRVLIVDDNATSQRILTLQMEAWGMAPRATGSPAEALGWIGQDEPFDLAIVDRQMPEIDGLMLASEIRKHRDAGMLPLVMVSSVGRGEAGEEEGLVDAFVLKPIRASQLYNVVVGILAPTKAAAVPEEPKTAQEFDPEMGKRLPLRILLAEDNVVNQKLAQRLLQRLGYRADVAGNGLEAVQALRRQTYDVVLMDVQMPEMDGMEATSAIRQEWPQERQPRIIALTANVMKEDREACLAAGMDEYLGKPIRVDELIAALSRCEALD